MITGKSIGRSLRKKRCALFKSGRQRATDCNHSVEGSRDAGERLLGAYASDPWQPSACGIGARDSQALSRLIGEGLPQNISMLQRTSGQTLYPQAIHNLSPGKAQVKHNMLGLTRG
jgi:hypothetical protein